jgi:hypothetical protein
MHPPRFPYPRDSKRVAEKFFYNACKRQLGDEWSVLYEQHWHGTRNGQNQRGEADFLMLHPECGAFVVEVKGGEFLEVRDGKWYSTPHGSDIAKEISNPFTQAADSKSVLWDFLRKNIPSIRLRGELGHIVVFPGHRQLGDMSPQARRSLIIDEDDLNDLESAMNRVSRYFSQKSQLSASEIDLIKERLMPTFKLIGANRGHLTEFLDELDHLTEMQLTAFAMLRKNTTLTVHGGAGSGKTVLAFHRARELFLDGQKVLYLCSSEPLERFLTEEIIRAKKIHDSSFIQVRCATSLINFIRERSSIPIVNLPEDFIAACSKFSLDERNLFDAVIIDESQNISHEIAFGALMLLREGGYQYIFGDPNQATADLSDYQSRAPVVLRDPKSSALDVFGSVAPVLLNVNCRSSEQIVKFADGIAGIRNEVLGMPFKDVSIIETTMNKCSKTLVEAIYGYTAAYGLSPDEIKVLAPPDFRVYAGLFNELGNVNSDGSYVGESLIVDWLGDQPRLSEYVNFLRESQLISEFLASDQDKSDVPERRLYEFRSWQKNRQREHRSIVAEFGPSHKEPLENLGIGTDAPAQGMEFTAYFSNLFDSRELGIELKKMPRFGVTPIDEFIGLESHAVIAILPTIDPHTLSTHRSGAIDMLTKYPNEKFVPIVYTMLTRARALVTLVGDGPSLEFLNLVKDQ